MTEKKNRPWLTDPLVAERFEALYQLTPWYSPRHIGTIETLDEVVATPALESIDSLHTEHKKGLILSGPPGTGKTHAIHALLREILFRRLAAWYTPDFFDGLDWKGIAAGWQEGGWKGAYAALLPEEQLSFNEGQRGIVFITHAGLVRNLSEIFRGENPRAALMSDDSFLMRPYLFIDDMGRTYDDAGGWTRHIQDEFFDIRWQAMLPVWITTNWTGDQMRQWPGYERIIDRLADPSYTIGVVMPDKKWRVAR